MSAAFVLMDRIYSISEITRLIKERLESLGSFTFQGEISEIKYHASGHLYFTLKDDLAVLPCVMWRTYASYLSFRPEVGHYILAQGRLSVYPPHGKYQMAVESMQMAGLGNLFEKFEALKKKLREEGLFDESLKKTLPLYPFRVVIVTSETAAALQDAERVFLQNAPHVKRFLIPARMQGKGTEDSVIKALDIALTLDDIDIIMIIRGGGSIEDLWEFNNEKLARKIFNYPLPVVTGIGHETDFTIADFVADYRASTPTNAAEYVVRGWKDTLLRLNQTESRLINAMDILIQKKSTDYNVLTDRYAFRFPLETVLRLNENINMLEKQLKDRIQTLFNDKNHVWEQLDTTLRLTHPGEILKKGYAVIQKEDGKIYRSINEVHIGEHFIVNLHDGDFKGKVIDPEKSNE